MPRAPRRRETMAGEKPKPEPKAAGAKGRSSLLLLIAGVVLAGAAGGGAVMFWTRGAVPAAAPPAEEAHAPAGVLPVDPFVVNLADRGAQRFARVTVRLVVDTELAVKEIAEDPLRQARLRSTILELLAQQTSGAIVTPEGKAALKKAIADQATHVLEEQVRDVLFTDFVVQ